MDSAIVLFLATALTVMVWKFHMPVEKLSKHDAVSNMKQPHPKENTLKEISCNQ